MERLDRRLNARVEEMIANGLENELTSYYDKHYETILTALREAGVAEDDLSKGALQVC